MKKLSLNEVKKFHENFILRKIAKFDFFINRLFDLSYVSYDLKIKVRREGSTTNTHHNLIATYYSHFTSSLH